ncbi:MAG: hypothetical protein KDC54_02980 [Lewinella sp.]|nr:hypothetical protein [Lewinella sp.]
MSKQLQGLADLLTDYPELGAGLDQFSTEADDQLTSLVGIYTLLKLRLHAVVSLLPRQREDEEVIPGSSADIHVREEC